MALSTHPHPGLVDPRNWCVSCHGHVAEGMLCPVCLDEQARGVRLQLSTNSLLDEGKGTE